MIPKNIRYLSQKNIWIPYSLFVWALVQMGHNGWPLTSCGQYGLDQCLLQYTTLGAFGYFEVTHDITKYCKAAVFSKIGKKTPIGVRFSTVGQSRSVHYVCYIVKCVTCILRYLYSMNYVEIGKCHIYTYKFLTDVICEVFTVNWPTSSLVKLLAGINRRVARIQMNGYVWW